MRLLHKVLALSCAGMVGLYTLARATIPPTVYVLVSVEDAGGQPVGFKAGWSGPLYTDDGTLRPGMTVKGTDDLRSTQRHRDMAHWSWRPWQDQEYAVFSCRPGAEAAFAAMTDVLGAKETTLKLPAVSKLIPWSLETVTLRLPQRRAEPLGELMVTVLDADGSIPDAHPMLHLSSPAAALPLVFNLGAAFGTRNRIELGPITQSLPAGRYRIGIDHWSGLYCGHNAPSLDRHQRLDLMAEVRPGELTHVTLERPLGTRLDLDLSLNGDGGAFAAGREEFLEEWERHTLDANEPPPHRWRAKATLQRLDPSGQPEEGPAERYACRWDECRYLQDRYSFPVSGTIEGLRQCAPGRYRLRIAGAGIEPVTLNITLPDLGGGSVVLCLGLSPKPDS